jgi:hypothetical protein
MSRPRLEVADIIRSAGADFIERNRSWLRCGYNLERLAQFHFRCAHRGLRQLYGSFPNNRAKQLRSFQGPEHYTECDCGWLSQSQSGSGAV